MEDAVTAVDALGSTIASFDRGRNAEFSAENSIFDLGLYAAQLGQEKQIASASKKIVAPAFETIEVEEGKTEYVLAHEPKEDVTVIYALNGDGTLGEAFAAGSSASATEFVYDDSTHTITVPTGIDTGEELFIMYEYDMENGVAITADAISLPKKGKFILEVLGCDVCDQETLIHAYLVCEQAKLSGDVDYSFTTDGAHPFTIQCEQKYCDKEKKLFKLIIPNEE